MKSPAQILANINRACILLENHLLQLLVCTILAQEDIYVCVSIYIYIYKQIYLNKDAEQ
jgi:hypothetical protein